jgi:hypothetical protein
VPIRHLSRYSMTSNNSQKLPTTDRVIKSKPTALSYVARARVCYATMCADVLVRVRGRARVHACPATPSCPLPLSITSSSSSLSSSSSSSFAFPVFYFLQHFDIVGRLAVVT